MTLHRVIVQEAVRGRVGLKIAGTSRVAAGGRSYGRVWFAALVITRFGMLFGCELRRVSRAGAGLPGPHSVWALVRLVAVLLLRSHGNRMVMWWLAVALSASERRGLRSWRNSRQRVQQLSPRSVPDVLAAVARTCSLRLHHHG